MAYNPFQLSALVSNNGFTLWHYKTPDSVSDVIETGYFDLAASMLRAGDIMHVNCGGYEAPTTGTLAVTRSLAGDGGVVDVTYISPPAQYRDPEGS